MKKLLILVGLAALLWAVPTVMAAEEAVVTPAGTVARATAGSWFFPNSLVTAYLGAAIGAGIMVAGAARGIGNIGASAVEAIARQPEAGPQIFTSMLLSAALIEGFTLFGVVVALLIVVLKSPVAGF